MVSNVHVSVYISTPEHGITAHLKYGTIGSIAQVGVGNALL